ncbi:MAG: NAD(P)/FAD-dependent oxidoreductase [Candidatus Marinamargulisbacteria bacterium]
MPTFTNYFLIHFYSLFPDQTVFVVGAGAAGFFAAIHHKSNSPDDRVIIVEKSNDCLTKVKISGGGRCNVTHACFDPRQLCEFYPRGSKELRGLCRK